MKIDELTNVTLNPSKYDHKLPQFKQKTPSLPNVQFKNTIKIPQNAKKIGNYILGKSIGSGTFGKVHIGMHVLTGQKVAIKIIQKAKIKPKDVQRVKSQIQILRSTRHRHLIHLYEIIQTQKSLLLVTQYMSNGQLFSFIVKEQKISEELACKIFHQIIDGVQYLHRMGITHRDLKPQNIMIDFDNQIKIIDFSLSRTYSKGQRLNSACGSPCYASPQMIQGKNPYDPQLIDIWSCGVILYAMVCGALPFMDSQTSKLYKKIVSGTYRPIKGVSQDVKDLIQKILVVNPNKRITIQEIKQHPWWNTFKYQPSYGLYHEQKIQYDEEILSKTVALGFDRDMVIQSLLRNQKNKQTGAYYLLMKKFVRNGGVCSKYIGSSNFNSNYIQYPFSPFQQENSETAVDSGQLIVQMPQSNPEDPTCTCTQNIEPFKWWVFIGTKEYQKIRQQNQAKSIDNLSIINGMMNKKIFSLEQQNSKLIEQEENIQMFKIQRKRKKSQFYGKNYKDLYKGKLNLTQNESSKEYAFLQLIKPKKGDRISTLGTLSQKEKKQRQTYNCLSVGRFNSNLKMPTKYQNLPKIPKSKPMSFKNVKILEKTACQLSPLNNRRLKPIPKQMFNSLS